jgi:hypothetical protein
MATQQDKQQAIKSLQEQLNAIANLPSRSGSTLKDALQNKLDTLINTGGTFSDSEIADAYELVRQSKEQALVSKFEENKRNLTKNFVLSIIGIAGIYFIYKKFISNER